MDKRKGMGWTVFKEKGGINLSKNNKIKQGEVWFVEFPIEEDEQQFINRPVIVLDVEEIKVLSVKVTKHEPREDDPYDYPIIQWQESGLKLKSTARVAKVMSLSKDCFIFKIGTMSEKDMNEITELYIKFIQTQLATSE